MRASAKARGHQYYRDYSQRWRTANLEHVRAYNAEKSRLRRGLKGNPNGGSYTPDDINSIRERQDCRCAACGRGDIKLEVDHILAITKGGTNDPANIQLLCGSCNKSKHNHDFWEWMARKFGSPLSS
jgi:5-methylcytosine-specific restriction endonuclease McrA